MACEEAKEAKSFYFNKDEKHNEANDEQFSASGHSKGWDVLITETLQESSTRDGNISCERNLNANNQKLFLKNMIFGLIEFIEILQLIQNFCKNVTFHVHYTN